MPAASQSRAPLFAAWPERYQIVRKIGAGGFADVYEALDLELGREVALKVVDERRGFSTRVIREVETAAALDHPGIVALYDFFTDGENSYLVWELVDGVSLAELGGELSDAEAVDAVAQLLDALAYAHSQGVVHRDIKPQNVMLDGRGEAKVMDFGIARLVNAETLTQEGDMLGTVAYMSPEQAEGRRVGPASDVYSAGVVLYELLAGVNPVRGATAAETISNVVAGRITPLEDVRPDLPPELTDAVAAACARSAAERPPAAGLGEALRALAGRLATSRRAPAQRLLKPLVRCAPLLERVVGALLASLAVAVLLERLPAYPQSWTLFLAVVTALIWFVLPAAGLAWFLGTLAFPFFNVSLSLGAVYIALSLVLFAAVHRRPVAAVLPALAPVLMPFFGTLLVPVGAALFGRWRGPLIAGWAALVTYVYLRLLDVPRSPFTAFAGRSRLADRLVEAGNPFAAAGDLLAAAASPAALLQVALWAGLAFTLACVFALRRLEARLWAWAATFAGLFGVALIVPVEVWDRPAAVGPLLLATAVAAAVSGLVMVAVDPVRLDAPPLVEEAGD